MNLNAELLKMADESEKEDHRRRNLAMGVAGAAPFAGLIGQQKMIHEGAGPAVNFKELGKLVQPGDVLLTGTSGFYPAKGFVGLVSGNPKGYHTAVVTGHGESYAESHPSHGFGEAKFDPEERVQVLRPKLSPSERKAFSRRMETHGFAAETFASGVSDGLSHGGRVHPDAAEIARAGMYDEAGGIVAGLKHLFVPKLRSGAAVEAEHAKDIAAHAKFHRTAMDAKRMEDATDIIENSPKAKALSGKDFTHLFPECKGDTCSTVPAKLLPKKFQVVPGKTPSEIFPSDYLRSENFTSVGRYDPVLKTPLHELALTHAPILARIGVGAALAAGVYGASKLFGGKKKEPKPAIPLRGMV